MYRRRTITERNDVKVDALDEPGAGGACQQYVIAPNGSNDKFDISHIFFQKGTMRTEGINGCHNEDIIDILIDRIRGFQSGKFQCRENAIALTHLETAKLWLEKRTTDRVRRGVNDKEIK